jgi:xanthine dehydrogenase small subunit
MDGGCRFLLNDSVVETSLPPGTVVLDYVRGVARLTGTKEGCREGDCGACMVLLGERRGEGVLYRAVNSCLLPLGELPGRHLVTVEGLNPRAGKGEGASRGGGAGAAAGAGGRAESLPLGAVQRHLVGQGAVQCGFCTPGLVVALTGYLLSAAEPSLAGAVEALSGNICRCTGYAAIRRAAGGLLEELGRRPGGPPGDEPGRPPVESCGAAPGRVADRQRLERLVARGVLPGYFLNVVERLQQIEGTLPEPSSSAARGSPSARGPAPGGRPVETEVEVGGGTDLFVQRPEELLRQPLQFLSRHGELSRVWSEGGRLYLGGGLTVEELPEVAPLVQLYPQLPEFLRLFASAPIRARATLAGNIVNASPIGDLTIMLLALGASVGLGNGKAKREVRLQRFYRSYKLLDRKPGERLVWVALPLGPPGFFNFEKVSRRRRLDIATVNSAAWMRTAGGAVVEARFAAGGVAPVPLLLRRTSAFWEGRKLDAGTLEQGLATAQQEVSPIDDVRGSARYKRLLLRQLLLAHFIKAFPGSVGEEAWS